MPEYPVIAVNGTGYVVDPVRRTIQEHGNPDNCLKLPALKPQEIPFDHPQSSNRFRPSAQKPLLMTPGVSQQFGDIVICGCLAVLQELADRHAGIDYLQVFQDDRGNRLCFIEDGEGGAITALLPDEY
ncbi:MAG: hypothetical protein IT428_09765 [Planctomycetaceae bacterium]|nr:hypothetical protein [Planctomycetaceae bacterium]